MKEYKTNHAADKVVGMSDKEARDIRYALSAVADDESVDLDVDVEEAREVLDV